MKNTVCWYHDFPILADARYFILAIIERSMEQTRDPSPVGLFGRT
jgi:hypothetical protein